MNLSDVLEETVAGTLPPSRVDARTVYRAGVRRRRIRLAARAALVVLPVLALVTSLIVVVHPTGDEDPARRTPSTWVVRQVGGFDQKRLWAYVEPCTGCGFELHTSDNAGRTWTRYVVQEDDLRKPVLTTASGGVALVDIVIDPVHNGAVPDLGAAAVRVSPGGWGSFYRVPFREDPVVAAAVDSPVYCNTERYLAEGEALITGEDQGTVRIIDIPGRRFGPTPTQPPFACEQAVRSPDGSILAAGQDRGNGKPAAARSLDNGSTWQTIVFEPDYRFAADQPVVVTDLLGSKGGAVVVRFQQGSWTGVFRREPGIWRQLTPSGGATDPLVLAADNTLVEQAADRPWVYTVNRPGDTLFEPVGRPEGIGREPIVDSAALPAGGYVAFNAGHIWTSADGRSWKAIKLG